MPQAGIITIRLEAFFVYGIGDTNRLRFKIACYFFISIYGSFPSKQLKLLTAWTALHEDELNANWILLSAGDGYFKIEPLR